MRDLGRAAGAPARPRAPATFDTGLGVRDWRAQWIRRARQTPLDATDEYTYARKDFRIGASPIVRAMAYVSAGQQYQLHLDGEVVGARVSPSATPIRSTTRPPT